MHQAHPVLDGNATFGELFRAVAGSQERPDSSKAILPGARTILKRTELGSAGALGQVVALSSTEPHPTGVGSIVASLRAAHHVSKLCLSWRSPNLADGLIRDKIGVNPNAPWIFEILSKSLRSAWGEPPIRRWEIELLPHPARRQPRATTAPRQCLLASTLAISALSTSSAAPM